MLFSIIIPIYKVEQYLNECVDSVLNQKYEDCEIILVDDGSPDQCPLICDAYKDKYENVKVIHKENGGLSDARNAGLRIAQGEYIVFLDSDDALVDNSLFGISLLTGDKPDVIISEMLDTPDMSFTVGKPLLEETATDKDSVFSFVFTKKTNTWPVYQYIVRRELIETNKLIFPVGLLHEDVDWTSKLFLYAKSFAYYNRVWYLRRVNRQGSIMNSPKLELTLDMLKIVNNNIENSYYLDLKNNQRKILFERLALSGISRCAEYKRYLPEEQEQILCEIAQHREMFKYATKLTHKVFAVVQKIFGVKTALEMLSLLNR